MVNTEIDLREYRSTIGHFATGVTVITSGSGGDVHAMTANAVTSVSLEPTLLLFCVKKGARMAAEIAASGGFTVNILNQAQSDLSNYFAGSGRGDSRPHFEFIDWPGGARIRDCAVSIGCELYARYDGGDHWIAVGRVLALHKHEQDFMPLLFFQGAYAGLAGQG
jgi:flavin reductase (DIM6/NTAB) family NADH-FMN oxidoreductase RutF